MDKPEELVFVADTNPPLEVEFRDDEPEQKVTDVGIGISRYDSNATGTWRRWKNTIDLTSEKVHFFSRTKESQLIYLKDFVNKSSGFLETIIKH